MCNKTIKGVRHKCLSCPDWDACSSCMVEIEAIHPYHNFVSVDHPSKLKLKVIPQSVVQHANIACDGGCGALPIIGPRYKCAHPACDDVDLCASCVADPVARHPLDHPLVMFREPAKTRDVRSCVERAQSVQSSASVLPNDVRTLLQSIGRSPSGKSTATSAEFVKGPDGDQTLIIDVDASELGLSDRDIHVPISIPAASNVAGVVDEVASVLGGIHLGSDLDADLVASAPDHETLVRDAEHENEIDEVESAVATEDAPVADKLDARFLADVTILDGSVLPAGAEFHKVWAVVNSGSKAWPVGTRLVNVGGFSKMAGGVGKLSFEVPAAAVGEVVDLQAELKAPEAGGFASDFWRLQDAEGNLFGHR